jgi:hypothetical protein
MVVTITVSTTATTSRFAEPKKPAIRDRATTKAIMNRQCLRPRRNGRVLVLHHQAVLEIVVKLNVASGTTIGSQKAQVVVGGQLLAPAVAHVVQKPQVQRDADQRVQPQHQPHRPVGRAAGPVPSSWSRP